MISRFNKRLILVLLMMCVCFSVFAFKDGTNTILNYEVKVQNSEKSITLTEFSFYLSSAAEAGGRYYMYLSTFKGTADGYASIEFNYSGNKIIKHYFNSYNDYYEAFTNTNILDSFTLELLRNNLVISNYVPSSYTVTLDSQNGTGGTASVTATYDSAMPSGATPPTRTGYTFAGYYDATSGGTQYYKADMSSVKIWDKTADTTLYAQWTANTNTAYKVKHYKQNIDGTYPDTPNDTDNLTGTTAANVTPEVKTYTGFTAPAKQTVSILADGSSVVTYQYTRNSYDVTFNVQGHGTAPAKASVKYENKVTKPADPTATGYTFGGWYKQAGCTSAWTFTSDVITEATTLYAKWTINKYTLAWNGNEGSLSGGTTAGKVDYNTSLTAPNATRNGYTFNGWNPAVPATMPASDATYTAQWTANTYTVKFNVNGGSGTMNNQSFTYDSTQALTANGFTKTGYTFAGWATSTSGNVVYSDKQSVSNLTSAANGTVNLYAKWTANSYNVTLDNNEGTGGSGSVTATYDSAMPNATKPTRTGYTFNGYFDATSGGTKYYNVDMLSTKTWDKPNVATLYAQWTENDYSVSINDNGGTGGSESVTAKYDIKVASVSIPTRTGYEFGGYWTDASEGIKIIDENGNIIYEVEGYTDNEGKWKHDGAVTLYAHWIGIQKVDFDKEATSGVVFGLNLESLGSEVTRVDIITPSSVADASGNRVSSTKIVSYTDLNQFKDLELGLYVFKAETSPVNYDEQIIAKVYGNDTELLKKTSSPKDCALALVSNTDVNVIKQAKAYLMYCEAMKNLYYTNIASSYEFYNSYKGSFEAVEWDSFEDAVINKDTSIINDYSALDVKSSSDFEMNLGVSEKTSLEFLIKAKKIESGEYRRQDEFKVTVTDLGSATVTSGETLIGLSDVFESGDVYYAIRIENIPVEELNQKYKFEITRTSRINPTKVIERYTGSFCALDFMKIYKNQNDSFIQAAEAMFLYNKQTKIN